MGYCEELDFCFKAKEKGFKSVLIDNLYVKHVHHASFKKKRNELLSKNNKILYKRWGNYLNCNLYKDCITDIIRESFPVHISKIIFICRKFIFISKSLKRQFDGNRVITLKNLFKTKNYKLGKRDKIIYTAFSGKYDILPICPTCYNNDWDYVLFTDNKTLIKLKYFGVWQIRPLAFDKLDATRNARWHKTHPHILFPEYKESLWIDANIDIVGDNIFKTIAATDKKMLIPRHYCRN